MKAAYVVKCVLLEVSFNLIDVCIYTYVEIKVAFKSRTCPLSSGKINTHNTHVYCLFWKYIYVCMYLYCTRGSSAYDNGTVEPLYKDTSEFKTPP